MEDRIRGGTEDKGDKNPWNTPTGKTAKGREGEEQRSKRDALFMELQRLDDATTMRLLLFLVHEMIENKYRCGT